MVSRGFSKLREMWRDNYKPPLFVKKKSILCLQRSGKQLAAEHVSGILVIKDFQYVQVSKLSGEEEVGLEVFGLKKKKKKKQVESNPSCNHSLQVCTLLLAVTIFVCL